MKLFLSIFFIFLLFSCNSQIRNNEKKLDIDSVELVLLVNASYKISHGWGHVFECKVKEVLSGNLEQDTIHLNVYATANLYEDLFHEFNDYFDVIISFRKTDLPYGPPPGFRDENNIWWEIIDVQKKE